MDRGVVCTSSDAEPRVQAAHYGLNSALQCGGIGVYDVVYVYMYGCAAKYTEQAGLCIAVLRWPHQIPAVISDHEGE
eukprot:m.432470 g.432470  ORF g.432470 m.432470 type:complete len:77 (+) comp89384_c0_seq1:56-286(+)